MPYQLQVKSVARRKDLGKIGLAASKNGLAVAAIIAPCLIDGVGSWASTTIGLTLYLTNQYFEFLDNQDLRKDLEEQKEVIEKLITDRFPLEGRKSTEIFAPTGSVSPISDNEDEEGLILEDHDTGYRLFNPLRSGKNAFGLRPIHIKYDSSNCCCGFFDVVASAPFIWSYHFLSACASFAITIAVIAKENPVWLHWTLTAFAILFGVLVVLLVPFAQHLTIANLERARDTYQDIIFVLTDFDQHGHLDNKRRRFQKPDTLENECVDLERGEKIDGWKSRCIDPTYAFKESFFSLENWKNCIIDCVCCHTLFRTQRKPNEKDLNLQPCIPPEQYNYYRLFSNKNTSVSNTYPLVSKDRPIVVIAENKEKVALDHHFVSQPNPFFEKNF